jgi:hypothetical protein
LNCSECLGTSFGMKAPECPYCDGPMEVNEHPIKRPETWAGMFVGEKTAVMTCVRCVKSFVGELED